MAQEVTDQIPSFKMVLSNGSFFSKQNIKKNKPVVLIYFSPDCDHCKALMKDFFKRATDFSKAEVVMITYKPLKDVDQFIDEYKIRQYLNITVGTEVPTYFIRYFYNLSNTPFTALFNRKGKLVYSYRNETPVDDLISRLRNIK
jgi:peroxiredoxin